MNEQEDRELQAVRAQISFGMDVQAFMNSSIGQRLAARANAVIAENQEALGEVDAEDPKAIRTLQNKIRAASYFLEWMGEAVTDGEQAQATFINAESQQD